jgi:hypothetical protein
MFPERRKAAHQHILYELFDYRHHSGFVFVFQSPKRSQTIVKANSSFEELKRRLKTRENSTWFLYLSCGE